MKVETIVELAPVRLNTCANSHNFPLYWKLQEADRVYDLPRTEKRGNMFLKQL